MNDIGLVMKIGQQALTVALQVSVPVLGFGMVAGLGIGVLQTATQIQDSTLAFVPKILATILALALFGPWMLQTLVRYATGIFQGIPNAVG